MPASAVEIHGMPILLVNGKDVFAPNPSISRILGFDPLLFDASKRGALHLYGDDGTFEPGTVMFTDFTLLDTWFAAMDSGTVHDFAPGVSRLVSCRDQEETDRCWEALSAVPESERCGWCVDRWGVSWQVVPDNLAELMANETTRNRILKMGEIDPTQVS